MKYKDTDWSIHGKCDTHNDIINEEEKEQYLIENGYCPACEKSTEEAIGNYYTDTFLCPNCCEGDWEDLVKEGTIRSEGMELWEEYKQEFINVGVTFQ